MKIAIAQINPIIADIKGNTAKIISYIEKARGQGADLVVFPEMTVLGYPPMDLLEKTKLIDDNIHALEEIAAYAKEIAVICGYVDRDPENYPMLFNAAAFMHDQKVQSKHFKTLLPTYDVFDEHRYFSPAKKHEIVTYMGLRLGITICEDIWSNVNYNENAGFVEGRRYPVDPVEILVEEGINVLINISASPFVKEKNKIKRERVFSLAQKYALTVVYANQVGGNDSLIFDGASFVVGTTGTCIALAKEFSEDLLICDHDSATSLQFREHELASIEKALVLGIQDYVYKCGFKDVLVGLSGGIDSALVATLAVKALGGDKVLTVTMPSHYSSKGSVDDSRTLAANLQIRLEQIAIRNLFDIFNKDLAPLFQGREWDVTEENLQARIRGNLLMAISNKFGSLLLTTGNKSELAMGYCTLYGDMSGGLAVISDLPKTLVFALAKYINRDKEIIPAAIIEKPPSAELREGQKDEDSLPPYDILDSILEYYIEKRMSAVEIIAHGFDEETVNFVLRTVDRNEYKRRQAAPGLKITSKAFGLGRRIPIAQRMHH